MYDLGPCRIYYGMIKQPSCPVEVYYKLPMAKSIIGLHILQGDHQRYYLVIIGDLKSNGAYNNVASHQQETNACLR